MTYSPRQLQRRLQRFPRVGLGLFPTPVHPAANLAEHLGSRRLFIKRDDLTGLGMGGNKTRSLEFLLGRAREMKAGTVIASGGLESNLCSQVAAACARLDLRAVLLHNDDPPDELRGNALLSYLAGAELQYLGPVSEREREARVRRMAEEMADRVYVVRNGASTPRGALGYMAAAAELARQIREENLPIEHVVIVGAMGGTAAGFLAGNFLLGDPFRLHIISVEYDAEELRRRLGELVGGVLRLMGRPVEEQRPFESAWLYEEFLGPGYAAPDAATLSAARAAASLEGIFCETVYVAKTLAGLMGLVTSGRIPADEAVCFFHTGGYPSLFGQREHFLDETP